MVLQQRSECRIQAAASADDWKLKNAKAEEKHNELKKYQEQAQSQTGTASALNSEEHEKQLTKFVTADTVARSAAEISVRKAIATRKRLDDFDKRLCNEVCVCVEM
jgi:ribosomal protein S4